MPAELGDDATECETNRAGDGEEEVPLGERAWRGGVVICGPGELGREDHSRGTGTGGLTARCELGPLWAVHMLCLGPLL